MLGNWLKRRGNRSRLVIATKIFFPAGEGPNDTGLSRKHIFDQIDASLRRLQTDYVDLYQMHCWDASTPLEETLRTLDDLVRGGKVRYIGASNYTPSQLTRAIMLSEMRGWPRFDCLQPEYSLLVRSTEWELLPLMPRRGDRCHLLVAARRRLVERQVPARSAALAGESRRPRGSLG